MPMDRVEYNLISTYLPTKGVNISTGYRESSICTQTPPWYFETIVFEFDPMTRERGKILHMQDSGDSEFVAFTSHMQLVERVIKGQSFEEEED